MEGPAEKLYTLDICITPDRIRGCLSAIHKNILLIINADFSAVNIHFKFRAILQFSSPVFFFSVNFYIESFRQIMSGKSGPALFRAEPRIFNKNIHGKEHGIQALLRRKQKIGGK